METERVDGTSKLRPVLGHQVQYLVNPELKEDQISWSSCYQAPIISDPAFARSESRIQELGTLIGDFRPIINAYSSATPEIEQAYLLEYGIAIIGKSYRGVDRESHRIRIMPKSDRVADLVELAKEIGLPHDFPEIKRFYQGG